MRMLVTPLLFSCCLICSAQNKMLVFQSDFGTKDGAVAAMKGVAAAVSPELKLYDLTHEIPAYNIWEASYRLDQTVPYWPSGTVFVSVVDPGVGTERKSIIIKTKSGHYIVTPDNGTLTHVSESLGVEAVHEIDEAINRRKNSEASYTFHGRDVYAYTAARLAAGIIKLNEAGKQLSSKVVTIPYQKAKLKGDTILGTIPILDVQYGNVWTNIPDSLFKQLNVAVGQSIHVTIQHNGKIVYASSMPFHETFGKVGEGKTLAYLNSLMQLSFAINMGNFAQKYKISSGGDWTAMVIRQKAEGSGQR